MHVKTNVQGLYPWDLRCEWKRTGRMVDVGDKGRGEIEKSKVSWWLGVR